MQLPDALKLSIENEIAFKSLQELSCASSDLTLRYRKGALDSKFVKTENDRLAYIISRMPATYAVIQKVLHELQKRIPSISIRSFLDLGTGPGTALWAAAETFSELKECQAWEYDEGFISLSKRLSKDHELLSKCVWQKKDFQCDRDFPSIDLALLSYSIGEVEQKYWEPFFKALWQKVEKALIIIEPGTPSGYQRILTLRDMLLKENATLIAPCPHEKKCPMSGQDWCHFFARIERSSVHRRIKHGELNFEDEKFSYLIFSKVPVEKKATARIIRHPKINKGYLNITLCDQKEMITEETITKKDKDKFKLIKKLDWGDCI